MTKVFSRLDSDRTSNLLCLTYLYVCTGSITKEASNDVITRLVSSINLDITNTTRSLINVASYFNNPTIVVLNNFVVVSTQTNTTGHIASTKNVREGITVLLTNRNGYRVNITDTVFSIVT